MDGIHGVIAQTARIIGVTVNGELLRRRVEAVQAGIGAEPQHSLPVLGNDLHVVLGETVGISRPVAVDAKMSGSRIEAVQPAAAGADPQHVLPVNQQCQYSVMTQAVRVVRFVPKREEPPGGGIQTVQPASVSAYPQHARAILSHGGSCVVGNTRRIPWIVQVCRELAGLPIQPLESVARANPEIASAVLMRGPD